MAARSSHRRTTRRGAAYVEILAIVGVVVTIGLVSLHLLGRSQADKADKVSTCMQSFSCKEGASSSGPGVALPSLTATAATPAPVSPAVQAMLDGMQHARDAQGVGGIQIADNSATLPVSPLDLANNRVLEARAVVAAIQTRMGDATRASQEAFRKGDFATVDAQAAIAEEARNALPRATEDIRAALMAREEVLRTAVQAEEQRIYGPEGPGIGDRLWQGTASTAGLTLGLGEGTLYGVGDTLVGLYTLVRHPVATTQALADGVVTLFTMPPPTEADMQRADRAMLESELGRRVAPMEAPFATARAGGVFVGQNVVGPLLGGEVIGLTGKAVRVATLGARVEEGAVVASRTATAEQRAVAEVPPAPPTPITPAVVAPSREAVEHVWPHAWPTPAPGARITSMQRRISVNEVSGSVQGEVRSSIVDQKIAEIRAILDGAPGAPTQLPQVKVVPDPHQPGGYVLIDQNHTFQAYRELGFTEIPAQAYTPDGVTWLVGQHSYDPAQYFAIQEVRRVEAFTGTPAEQLAARAAERAGPGTPALVRGQLGDLRESEISAIQQKTDELGADVYITGSAASGKRRGIGTDLPLADFGGSKVGTRSDIDYAVASHLDDAATNLKFPDTDPSFGVRGVDYISLDKGPVIRFSPGQAPVVIPKGTGRLPLK